MENILNVLLPYVVTVIGGWLTAYIITFIKTKIGLATYNKMKVIAYDVWKAIDEDTRLGDLIGTKFEAFEKMIRIKFPKITDADIKLLNKSIANEYNKDKPIVEKSIEEQGVVTVQPTVKYINENGVELKPVTDAPTT